MQTLTKILKNYQHVIWDWNGTILDDLALTLFSINKQLIKHGLKSINQFEHRENFFFPIQEYYKTLGFNFEKISYHVLADDFARDYFEKFHQAKVFVGMPELLGEIKQWGILQSMLSASFEEHLLRVVKLHQLDPYFDYLFGIPSLLADSKISRGQELITIAKVPLSKPILVGDTNHDLEVGKILGVDVLLLADGHQSYERLSKLHHQVLRSRY